MLLLLLLIAVVNSKKPEIKIIYIIPSDREPYEDYQNIMGELAKKLRDFFYSHLGLWLRFSDDIWVRIDVDHGVNDILNGTYTNPTNPNPTNPNPNYPYLNIYNYIKFTVKDKFNTEDTLFIGILVNDLGGFMGADGIASVGSPAIDRYVNTRGKGYDNSGYLYVLYHEVGHSLGAFHFDTTLNCFRRNWPELGVVDEKTFMSDFNVIGTEIPHMSPIEKLLFTNPSYTNCMFFRKHHPSEYFSDICLNKLPKGSSIDQLSTLLVNWGECTKLPCYDINCDDRVGIDDLSKVLVEWGSITLI